MVQLAATLFKPVILWLRMLFLIHVSRSVRACNNADQSLDGGDQRLLSLRFVCYTPKLLYTSILDGRHIGLHELY